MTVKELIDKLVLVEDTEYKESQAIEAVPMIAREANDKGLGFVLQWAKYGLKK